MTTRAAIDIGSNSLLLAVVDADGQVLHDECHVVGLGRGLGDRGNFAPSRMAHAREVLTGFVAQASALGVPAGEIQALATSGARRAVNAESFFGELHASLGLRIRTISGEEEARLSFLGALQGLPGPMGSVLVIDLGGGSTEVIMGEGDAFQFRASVEMGAVRLTEAFGLDGDRPRMAACTEHVESLLGSIYLPDHPTWAVAVAGTVTTLAGMQLGLTEFDAQAIHGSELTVEGLLQVSERMLAASPAERVELAAISPQRSDYLAAGALVIACVLRSAGLDSCLVSTGGLRFGALRDAPSSQL